MADTTPQLSLFFQPDAKKSSVRINFLQFALIRDRQAESAPEQFDIEVRRVIGRRRSEIGRASCRERV